MFEHESATTDARYSCCICRLQASCSSYVQQALTQAASVQTFGMGEQQEMLVTVRAPKGKEGPKTASPLLAMSQPRFQHHSAGQGC